MSIRCDQKHFEILESPPLTNSPTNRPTKKKKIINHQNNCFSEANEVLLIVFELKMFLLFP